ncbi:unnamed protein product [Periconia digitata]|uniref:Copper homeostasis protein cutC homolog n=1 Tax=Periconia digitata TaxID=1303443 RepID=A0A9W4UIB2_9PLEO|nr:unnamed protein product [Periconia digitata]
MIRPRAGDFTYTDSEFAAMKASIALFKAEQGTAAAASGFVFGILNSDGATVDISRNRELVELAAPLPCTFHRAFDQVRDMRAAAEELVACGFAAILTSGVPVGGAIAGAEVVRRLEGDVGGRIALILGGGVREGNVGELRRVTGVRWFHSAAVTADVGEDVDGAEVERLRARLDEEV